MDTKTPAPIESLISEWMEQFDGSPSTRNLKKEKENITLSVPVEYKLKYDMIQGKSKKSFNRVLEQVFIRSLDLVDLDKLGA